MNLVLRAAVNTGPIRVFAAFCLFALVYVCYHKGLSGPFLLDDFGSVFNARIDSLSASEMRRVTDTDLSSMFGRLLPVISFALNDHFGDGNPYSYKLTNLGIHAATTLAMYCFLAKLLILVGSSKNRFSPSTASILAFGCTALWALHPLQISTVLYVVQRMAMLSTLFTVLALWLFLILRTSHLHRTTYALVVVGILMSILAACLSKENGVLAIAFMVFIEITILRFHDQDDNLMPKYRNVFFALSGMLCLLAVAVFTMVQSKIMSGYVMRDYGALERLMTQPGVLLWYVKMIILPNISEMSLYHDAYPIQRVLGMPTLIAIGFWAVVLGICAALYKKLPILGFGLGLFLISHSLESTILPLETVFEHRNYFGMIGVILPIVVMAYKAAKAIGYPSALKFLGLLAILQLSFLTHARAIEWSDTELFHRQALIKKPDSIRALNAWTTYLASQGKIAETITHLEHSHSVRPDSPHFLIQLLMFSGAVIGPNEPLLGYVQEQLRTNPFKTEEVATLNEMLRYKYEGRVNWPTMNQIGSLYQIASSHPDSYLKIPTESVLFRKYSDILRETGQPDKALENIVQSLNLAPESPRSLLALAQLQFELGHVGNASVSLEQLMNADTHNEVLKERSALAEQIRKFVIAESEGS